LQRFVSEHLISYRIVSQRIASGHMISYRFVSDLFSHRMVRIASCRVVSSTHRSVSLSIHAAHSKLDPTLNHITFYRIVSYRIATYCVLSCRCEEL
jgi:hypothetical protein